MSPADAAGALAEALAGLERAALRGRVGRAEVRPLLLALGAELRARGAEAAPELSDRVRAAAAGREEALGQAIDEELALACAEHMHGVDPRFLDRPDYDLGYTLAARERLELRRVAAAALGRAVPAHLAAGVARADHLLDQRLRRAGGAPGPTG